MLSYSGGNTTTLHYGTDPYAAQWTFHHFSTDRFNFGPPEVLYYNLHFVVADTTAFPSAAYNIMMNCVAMWNNVAPLNITIGRTSSNSNGSQVIMVKKSNTPGLLGYADTMNHQLFLDEGMISDIDNKPNLFKHTFFHEIGHYLLLRHVDDDANSPLINGVVTLMFRFKDPYEHNDSAIYPSIFDETCVKEKRGCTY